ncbi:DUF1868 domain-containing protein [Rhizobium sp. FY34]|uniref:DUF1868 domain-containing protein n=1 Tax=Rhizobium sp. FY34 TaxID=2562309 RepID=UPI00148559C4|nr:DUF1868 domain-containing protein [Rhizobium sp. FY34]
MTPTRPDAVAHLTGKLSDQPRPGGISLPGGGGKFHSDGSVQHWPGNTFICHIDRGSRAFEAIRALQEEIKRSQFNRFFTFLPPSSFHMTVFQGISPATRPGEGWPDGIAWPMERDTVSAEILNRIEHVKLSQTHRIRVIDLFAAHSLTVAGATEPEEDALRAERRVLGGATRMPQADFDSYVFHISLAYQIDWVSEPLAREIVAYSAQLSDHYRPLIGEITLGPVEFCRFDTMHHFEPLRELV